MYKNITMTFDIGQLDQWLKKDLWFWEKTSTVGSEVFWCMWKEGERRKIDMCVCSVGNLSVNQCFKEKKFGNHWANGLNANTYLIFINYCKWNDHWVAALLFQKRFSDKSFQWLSISMFSHKSQDERYWFTEWVYGGVLLLSLFDFINTKDRCYINCSLSNTWCYVCAQFCLASY